MFLNILIEYNEFLGNTHDHMTFIHYFKSYNTLKTEFINNTEHDFKEQNMNSKITRQFNIDDRCANPQIYFRSFHAPHPSKKRPN